MEIVVLRPQFMPAEMVAHWRALQAAQPDADSPFLSPDWPRAVERAQGGADRGLRIAVLHAGGRPHGFLAVRVTGGAAMPPGAPLCEAQGLVAEAGVTPDLRRLLKALGVGRLDFTHMPAADEAFTPHVRGEVASDIIDVDSGCELPAEADGREALERQGSLTFTALSRSKADFDQLYLWRRNLTREARETDVFVADWTQRLVKDLFASRDPAFGGALFTLHAGERLAAAAFALRGAGATLHALAFAHDPYFDDAAPDLVLLGEVLRWMQEGAYRRLELGAGPHPFARELANASRPLVHGFVGAPSPAAWVRGAQYRLRSAAEALPLGPLSRLPAEAMRRADLRRGLR